MVRSLLQGRVIGDDFGGRYSGWAISAGALLIYLATLSRHYTADSLLYALTIENGGIRALIDPTHLLLHPLGWSWYQFWLLAGWREGSLLPLELLNALAGAACVGLVYSLARRMFQSTLIAGIVAAGFALSGGLWLLSVEAEFVTVPLAFSLLVLWLTLVPSPSLLRNPFYPVIVGLATAAAILAYANNLLLVPPVLLGLWLRTETTPERRKRTILVFLLSLLLAAVPVMAAGLVFWTGGDWSQVARLFGGGVYGHLAWFNIPQGLYTFLRSFALFRGLAMNDSTERFLKEASSTQKATFTVYYALIALIISLPILKALLKRRALWSNYRREILVLLSWTILFGAFGFYWVPGDISFWMPLLVSWWLLLGFVLALRGGRRNRFQIAYYLLPITFVVAIAIANWVMVVWPRRDLAGNQFYQAANEVTSQTSPGDLVVADAAKTETLYLVYFSNRWILPVKDIKVDRRQLAAELSQTTQWRQAGGGQAFIFTDGTLKPLQD